MIGCVRKILGKVLGLLAHILRKCRHPLLVTEAR